MSSDAKPATAGYLIAFTDAKGSTELDESAIMAASVPFDASDYQNRILKLRENLFHGQLEWFKTLDGWQVIKSVGDALVLSVAVPRSPDAPTLVEGCLQELFHAWKSANRSEVKIRVAVHYSESGHLASGEHLATKLRALLASRGLTSLEAFLGSLKSDLFGSGINRSARLAHAPSGPLFVLSQSVLEKLIGRSILPSDIESQLASQKPLYSGRLPMRGPIPLVKVKGIDSIGIGYGGAGKGGLNPRPWWIWELIDDEFPTDDDKVAVVQSFGAENKRFQVIRLIQTVFPMGMTLRERGEGTNRVANAADAAFESHLKARIELTFFSDLILKVVDTWGYYRPSDERDFTNDEMTVDWRETKSLPAEWLPYYAIFSSCPNEAADEVVREGLVEIPEGSRIFPDGMGKFKLEAISHQIHRGVRWASPNVAISGTSAGRRLYLILFQVRSSWLNVGGDPDKLFANLNPSFGDGGTFRWNVIAMGVIRGDKDGFVLVSCAEDITETPDESEANLKRFLKAQCKDNRNDWVFWHRIAPIRVLVCKSMSPIQKTHLDWLKECLVRR